MPFSNEYRHRLFGWLSYAFARYVFLINVRYSYLKQTFFSEVFVIVSLTLFLPICLEQFARDNGFLLPDKVLPCFPRLEHGKGASIDGAEAVRCVVKVGWVWIDTASYRFVY